MLETSFLFPNDGNIETYMYTANTFAYSYYKNKLCSTSTIALVFTTIVKMIVKTRRAT